MDRWKVGEEDEGMTEKVGLGGGKGGWMDGWKETWDKGGVKTETFSESTEEWKDMVDEGKRDERKK